jgi:amino acid transporter
MAICRHYPDGGGVYASVHHRSKVIAIVGAFLLVADYIVTASISALFGFQYVGVPHPGIFAGVAILGIGALNFFGPRRTGELAVAISVRTVITVVVLAFFSLPHLGEAWHNLKPLSSGFLARLEPLCCHRSSRVRRRRDRKRGLHELGSMPPPG